MISIVPDAHISQLHSQREELYLELEGATQAFIRAAQAFAEEELKRRIEQAVISQYALTRRLGEKGLGVMKRELEELMFDTLPEVVLGHLNQHGLWPHRNEGSSPRNVAYAHYRTSTVSALPVELSRAIGGILKYTAELLLKKRGYVFVGMGNVQSEEMMAAFQRYSEFYFGGTERYGELKCPEIEDGKAEAKRLWDEA